MPNIVAHPTKTVRDYYKITADSNIDAEHRISAFFDGLLVALRHNLDSPNSMRAWTALSEVFDSGHIDGAEARQHIFLAKRFGTLLTQCDLSESLKPQEASANPPTGSTSPDIRNSYVESLVGTVREETRLFKSGRLPLFLAGAAFAPIFDDIYRDVNPLDEIERLIRQLLAASGIATQPTSQSPPLIQVTGEFLALFDLITQFIQNNNSGQIAKPIVYAARGQHDKVQLENKLAFAFSFLDIDHSEIYDAALHRFLQSHSLEFDDEDEDGLLIDIIFFPFHAQFRSSYSDLLTNIISDQGHEISQDLRNPFTATRGKKIRIGPNLFAEIIDFISNQASSGWAVGGLLNTLSSLLQHQRFDPNGPSFSYPVTSASSLYHEIAISGEPKDADLSLLLAGLSNNLSALIVDPNDDVRYSEERWQTVTSIVEKSIDENLFRGADAIISYYLISESISKSGHFHDWSALARMLLQTHKQSGKFSDTAISWSANYLHDIGSDWSAYRLEQLMESRPTKAEIASIAIKSYYDVVTSPIEQQLIKMFTQPLWKNISQSGKKTLSDTYSKFNHLSSLLTTGQIASWGDIALGWFHFMENELRELVLDIYRFPAYRDWKIQHSGKASWHEKPTMNQLLHMLKDASRSDAPAAVIDALNKRVALHENKGLVITLLQLFDGYRNPAAHGDAFTSKKFFSLHEKMTRERILQNFVASLQPNLSPSGER